MKRARRMPHAVANDDGVDAHHVRLDERIRLNVGGVRYETTRATLVQSQPQSMLSRMFDPLSPFKCTPDANGEHFIDRDGRAFGAILNILRTNRLSEPHTPLLDAEMDFFQVIDPAQTMRHVDAATREGYKLNALKILDMCLYQWDKLNELIPDDGSKIRLLYVQQVSDVERRKSNTRIITSRGKDIQGDVCYYFDLSSNDFKQLVSWHVKIDEITKCYRKHAAVKKNVKLLVTVFLSRQIRLFKQIGA
jgi:hypothetical protein